MICFAYGSNMSARRLAARLPAARRLGSGRLDGFALRFHKLSDVDGSGKCDIVADEAAAVHGVLFAVTRTEKSRLDAIEGVGQGYRNIVVSVVNAADETIEASAYQATRIQDDIRPFDWYKRHVLEGAREAGFPGAYVTAIGAVASIADPDRDRAARELAIYALRNDIAD